MSEENKSIVRCLLEEAYSTGNLAVVDEIIAPDYVHTGNSGRIVTGIEFIKQQITIERTIFPDLRVTIEEMIAEGEKVVARGRFGRRAERCRGQSWNAADIRRYEALARSVHSRLR